MILTSFAIALIAIIFGAQLLAQSQKENLNALYKYLAWFVMAMGFCVLLCDGLHGILRMHNMHQDRMMHREAMMDRRMGGNGCPMSMNCNDGNMNCCNSGNMNCCGNNDCSGPNNMDCHEGGMNSSCKGGMPADCPMMGNVKSCKSDSSKEKK